jgi:hypothetical protein
MMSNDDEFREEVIKRLRPSFPEGADISEDELVEACKDTITLAAIRLRIRWGQFADEFWKAWSVK